MISKPLVGARAVREFCVGKTIVGVAEPLDTVTRFRFADGSALLVALYPSAAGVEYYAEPAL